MLQQAVDPEIRAEVDFLEGRAVDPVPLVGVSFQMLRDEGHASLEEKSLPWMPLELLIGSAGIDREVGVHVADHPRPLEWSIAKHTSQEVHRSHADGSQ